MISFPKMTFPMTGQGMDVRRRIDLRRHGRRRKIGFDILVDHAETSSFLI